jgi:hypothetical protein
MKEADSQAPVKLKLQLFPINEATRKALEKVKHGFLLLVNCIGITISLGHCIFNMSVGTG